MSGCDGYCGAYSSNSDIKLKDEIKMKLTVDEKMAHNNACLT